MHTIMNFKGLDTFFRKLANKKQKQKPTIVVQNCEGEKIETEFSLQNSTHKKLFEQRVIEEKTRMLFSSKMKKVKKIF
jgi:hypothetical protein